LNITRGLGERDLTTGWTPAYSLNEQQAAHTADFIIYSALTTVARRPDVSWSWTENWPYEPEVGNAPTTNTFVLALALGVWAVATMTRAGSNVPADRPTTIIVEHGPYRFTRNPIYLGMFLGQIGLAIAFNTLWLLMTLASSTLLV
jgi:protein-S-isoprenylcysteine O-methyltransferase Ste14